MRPSRSIRIAASRARRSQLPSASTSAARSSAMRVRSVPAVTRSAWVSEIDDSRAWRKVRRISASATSPTISAIACSVPAMARAQLVGAARHVGMTVARLGGDASRPPRWRLRGALGGTRRLAGFLRLAPRRLGDLRARWRAPARREPSRPRAPRQRALLASTSACASACSAATPSICWRMSASRLRWLRRTAAVDGAPARIV